MSGIGVIRQIAWLNCGDDEVRGLSSLVLVFGCLITSLAFAEPFPAATATAGNSPRGEIQVAQAYEFEVFIDAQGREVIVDPVTRRVVEVREPLAAERAYPGRADRGWQTWERGRRYYDFTDPRDVERFHREREEAIYGRQDSYDYEEPDYGYEGEYGYDRGYDYGDPRGNPRGRNRGYVEPAWPQVRNGSGGSIERAPLAPPSQMEARSVVPAPELSPDGGSVEDAARPTPSIVPDVRIPTGKGASEEVAKFQILLDRAGASPGVIDGRMGDNVNKAIAAYYEITGERLRTYDKEWIEAELERTGGPAFIDYEITSEDAAGPYIASVPEDYSEKARLERLGYTRVSEMLAERFHMDEKYLLALNPGVNFDRPGTIIKVANVNFQRKFEVARIVADKEKKQLRVYDSANRLVASYPATIGSQDTPSPSGTHTVERIALNPEYTYNPKINFKQGNNDRILRIPPGPNNPVGSVWIALSKPTYGIHGTPEPEKIGKTFSHGCIRLTNWDAEELAKNVKPGTPVEFL